MPEKLAETLPDISHGDHCCLFFSSPVEQARITAPFLALGLERQERCVYVGDAESVDVIRQGLKNAGISIDKEVAKNRLLLMSEQDYLDGGHWKTEKMLGFLQVAYESALSDGFTALRAAGDVSWQVGPDKDFQEVVYYETLLDLFFVGKRMIGLCEYPKEKCPPDTLRGILNTHKIAAIDSNICSNFHYVAPELLLEKDEKLREVKRVQWMTSQLLRAKKAEEERDAMQQQLLQSQKLEAIGRLAGAVAHDFNNILTAILGLSDFVLARAGLDGEVKSDVKEIKLSGERAAALTRRLLAFSRRQSIEPRVINLNEIIQTMENFLRRLIRENIELKILLGREIGNVKGDPSQIEQIIMNLAVNARDAMPRGGTLTLETSDVELSEDFAQAHSDVSPGPHVMLTVSDTGHGMDQATIPRIFEPLFTTKDKKGTGLGLFTVHSIIKQSCGSIFVYSEPGHGSTFKIYLPRVDGKLDIETRPGPKVDSLRGTETVLLVEDDDVVRKLVHRSLVDYGYTVLTAISAQEAVRFCERHKGTIHMLITDAVLSETTGRELANQVGILRPKIKVMFMSGYADDAVDHGAHVPGKTFIQKPFTPEALARKVREALDV